MAGCEGDENSCLVGCAYEHLYGEPHGVFARPAEPIPAHLSDLCDRVRNSEAVVGFAQDPDADRLVLVDERRAHSRRVHVGLGRHLGTYASWPRCVGGQFVDQSHD